MKPFTHSTKLMSAQQTLNREALGEAVDEAVAEAGAELRVWQRCAEPEVRNSLLQLVFNNYVFKHIDLHGKFADYQCSYLHEGLFPHRCAAVKETLMVKTFSSSARRQRGAAWLAVMVVLAVAAGVGGMFGADRTSPRILLEQALRNADPAWGVALTPDKQELQIGRDRMGLRINTGRAGHLLVLQAGTDGRSLELIFPNDLDQETSIAVGETVLPRPNWQLDAAGPAGDGTLLAVVADYAPDMVTIRAAVARGILPELGAYGAALATWRETALRK